MAALGDHTEIVWIPGYVFASVLLSVAFSVVSLLLARRGDTPRQLAAASLRGGATRHVSSRPHRYF
jgi:NO-binding membrane sensor protein with MHYT domain